MPRTLWAAYKNLAASKEQEKVAAAAAQNWLPAVAAITVAAVLIVSGLVFWQRSRRSDLGVEAYRSGEKLLAQGQVDEAVSAFRNALAHAPQDVKARAALGLALVQSGQFDDASSYLSGVVKADPQNGPVWLGLAEISLAAGDKKQALQLFRQALSKEWPASEESRRRSAQLKYASLLSDAGRRGEAVSLLLSIIAQHGDDSAVGKEAADIVKAIGTPGTGGGGLRRTGPPLPRRCQCLDEARRYQVRRGRRCARLGRLPACRGGRSRQRGCACRRGPRWKKFFAWTRPGGASP